MFWSTTSWQAISPDDMRLRTLSLGPLRVSVATSRSGSIWLLKTYSHRRRTGCLYSRTTIRIALALSRAIASFLRLGRLRTMRGHSSTVFVFGPYDTRRHWNSHPSIKGTGSGPLVRLLGKNLSQVDSNGRRQHR